MKGIMAVILFLLCFPFIFLPQTLLSKISVPQFVFMLAVCLFYLTLLLPTENNGKPDPARFFKERFGESAKKK